MAGSNNTVVISFSIAMFLLLILLLVVTYNSKCQMDNVERFYTNSNTSVGSNDIATRNIESISSGNGAGVKPASYTSSVYKEIEQKPNEEPEILPTQTAGTCVNKDRLTSADLLPIDANSKWAELNPQCSGDVQDQNYLTAGHHIGINTVGQSLRNANLQLRYEPPNPQIPVSPWQISTIEPDQRVNGLLDIGAASPY
jgi:hypothetical protein